MSRPFNTNKNTKPILEKEYKQLITYTKGLDTFQTTKDKWIRTIEILWISGLRISEILNIKVKDIRNSIEKCELRVYISKQNIIRHIPLSQKSINILKKLISNDLDNESYFIHKRNCKKSKLNPYSFTYEFNQYLQFVLNSKDYSSHSFRKGLITQMSMKGINPKITQTFIGHKSVTTTLNYYKPTIEDVRECLVR
ncbi:tyrosine-type recombinase/integrase [Malaciobacter sp. WC5094]